MPGENFSERAGDRIDRDRAQGEVLPAWFASVEKRVDEEVARLAAEQQLRIAQGRAGSAESAAIAAQSAENIKRAYTATNTQALENNKRMSFAFEVFTALGFKGKAADVRGGGTFKPGYLGRLTEATLANESQDIHEGVDVVVRIPTAEGEIVLGLDVTTSPQKLEQKYRKIREGIELGVPTANKNGPGIGTNALKAVVGISSAPMRSALMEWGREGKRREAYESIAIGARMREQILVQFEEYAKLANECGHPALSGRYRLAIEKLKTKGPEPLEAQALKEDAMHQEILKRAKAIARA